jgi:CTP synthase
MKCWPPSASKARRRPHGWTLGRDFRRIHNPEGEVTIAVVGKYTGLKDAYKSLIEALTHGGIANRVKVNIEWIESEIFEKRGPGALSGRRARHPGAGRLWRARRGRQDRRGQFARERKVPYFGICLRHADGGARRGAQSGRHRGRHRRPNSTAKEPVVGLMTEWLKGNSWRSARAGRSGRHHAAGRL